MTTLLTLLDQGLVHDPVYGRELANHLPMALVSLHRLGASDEHLQRFAAEYPARVGLRPARPATPWPTGDAWASRLGRADAWPAYRDLFTQWLRHESPAEVLVQVLPTLMQGCAAAAFHGLIRTAYGVQAMHMAELVEGLAHWAAAHQPLGAFEPNPRARERDPVALLRSLNAGTSRRGLIAERMADAAKEGHVNQVVGQLFVDEHTPQRLARAAAYAYAHSGSFTALHLVTACHALRVVMQAAGDDLNTTDCVRGFWQAYAHGVVAATLRASPTLPTAWDWAPIVAAALAHEDVHVIKLVDSCREHERAIGVAGDDLWRLAATRAVASS